MMVWIEIIDFVAVPCGISTGHQQRDGATFKARQSAAARKVEVKGNRKQGCFSLLELLLILDLF
jgi:hypothetical protein